MHGAQKRYYFEILLIIALAAALRFFMLTNQSLWSDEGASLYFSGGASFAETFSRIAESPGSDRFHPLGYLILFVWRRVFGDSEFVLRSFSALCGTGAVLISYYACLQLYDKRRAFWLLIMLSVSSYLVYYSQEVRHYGLLFLFVALQLYLFGKIYARPYMPSNLVYSILFWFIIGISIFANIFMIIFTTGLCVSHFLAYRDKQQWLYLWVPAVLFSLPPILFFASGPHGSELGEVGVSRLSQSIIENTFFTIYGILVGTSYGPPPEILRSPNRVYVVMSYWPQLSVLFIILGSITLCLLLLYRRDNILDIKKQHDYFFISLFIISFILFIISSSIFRLNFQPRHGFFLHLPLAFILTSFFNCVNKDDLRKIYISNVAKISVILLVILNIYSLFNYYFDKDYARDDYRSVAKFLNTKPEIPSVLLFGSANLLKYYGYEKIIDGKRFESTRLPEKIRETTMDSDTVLIVLNRGPFWRSQQLFEASIDGFYRHVDMISFRYFKIYTLEKKI
jgi:uncharacterized membrane protein